MRRLPIYLVIDTSESMAGEPIDAVQKGLTTMLSTLRKDPYALEMAYISIITFGTTAKQITPLTEVAQFQVPSLLLGSGTVLGAALDLLESKLKKEVQKSTAEEKGDYKPVVFLFTDGEPTDQWQSQADRFIKNQHLTFIAIGCGQDVNIDVLRRISKIVILGKDADEETLKRFFQFVSASVATASQSADQTGETKVSLEKLPVGDDIQVVDDTTPQQKIEPKRFIFIHNKCIKSKKFYLQKYVKSGTKVGGFLGLGRKDAYIGAGTFPLDDFEEISKGSGVTVDTGLLENPDPCPYCGNKIWGMCGCGKTHCCPDIPQGKTATLSCPWCGTTATYGYGSNFSVGGGGG